jgi:hypothetical protein
MELLIMQFSAISRHFSLRTHLCPLAPEIGFQLTANTPTFRSSRSNLVVGLETCKQRLHLTTSFVSKFLN